MKIELHGAIFAAAIEAIVVGEERGAWPKRDDESFPSLRAVNIVRCKKFRADELAKMRSELVALDDRLIFAYSKSAQPFDTDVVVSFCEEKSLGVMAVVQICEVKK